MDIQQVIRDAGITIVNEMLRAWQVDVCESLFNQPISYAAYTEYGVPPFDPDKTVEGSIAHPVTNSARLLPAGEVSQQQRTTSDGRKEE